MPSILRVVAAIVVARGSRDRGALDLLLTVDDLPAGWHRQRERRFRVGLVHGEEWDERARRERLVGAMRRFEHSETNSVVLAGASPRVTTEDARSALSVALDRRFPSFDLNAQTLEETEVTPPPEAGEHARALLVLTTGRGGPYRRLSVIWAEDSVPIVLSLSYRAPADVDVWELTASLIERQRQRAAARSEAPR